jgi:hypothetical protein
MPIYKEKPYASIRCKGWGFPISKKKGYRDVRVKFLFRIFLHFQIYFSDKGNICVHFRITLHVCLLDRELVSMVPFARMIQADQVLETENGVYSALSSIHKAVTWEAMVACMVIGRLVWVEKISFFVGCQMRGVSQKRPAHALKAPIGQALWKWRNRAFLQGQVRCTTRSRKMLLFSVSGCIGSLT